MLRLSIFYLVLLTTVSAYFNPTAYFKNTALTEGEIHLYEVSDTLLLHASQQVLQVHGFKLAEIIRQTDGSLVLLGEKITTELLKMPPLNEGAIRLWIKQIDPNTAKIQMIWHSFYRKNLKTRIIEDKNINTAKFFIDLDRRLKMLTSTTN
jgi:hypothetical protein